MPDEDDDRQMLQAIIAHCSAHCETAEQAGPVAEARRKMAYATVARAARELLEEIEG